MPPAPVAGADPHLLLKPFGEVVFIGKAQRGSDLGQAQRLILEQLGGQTDEMGNAGTMRTDAGQSLELPAEDVVVHPTLCGDNFDLPSGRYILRMHFAEGFHDQAGKRLFDVALNGRKVLEKMDIHDQAGGKMKAIHRDIPVQVGAKGLEVEFVKIADNPSLNGLEIFKP